MYILNQFQVQDYSPSLFEVVVGNDDDDDDNDSLASCDYNGTETTRSITISSTYFKDNL